MTFVPSLVNSNGRKRRKLLNVSRTKVTYGACKVVFLTYTTNIKCPNGWLLLVFKLKTFLVFTSSTLGRYIQENFKCINSHLQVNYVMSNEEKDDLPSRILKT